MSSSFACDFALSTLLKLDATIPGSDTKPHVMESWGKNVIKAWVSHNLVSLFPLITIDFLRVITIVPCKVRLLAWTPWTSRNALKMPLSRLKITSGLHGASSYSQVYRRWSKMKGPNTNRQPTWRRNTKRSN